MLKLQWRKQQILLLHNPRCHRHQAAFESILTAYPCSLFCSFSCMFQLVSVLLSNVLTHWKAQEDCHSFWSGLLNSRCPMKEYPQQTCDKSSTADKSTKWLSSDCEIICPVQMDNWDVKVWGKVALLEAGTLIQDTICCQILCHVELPQLVDAMRVLQECLPDVGIGMGVKGGHVALADILQALLSWDFQDVLLLCQHVLNSNRSAGLWNACHLNAAVHSQQPQQPTTGKVFKEVGYA